MPIKKKQLLCKKKWLTVCWNIVHHGVVAIQLCTHIKKQGNDDRAFHFPLLVNNCWGGCFCVVVVLFGFVFLHLPNRIRSYLPQPVEVRRQLVGVGSLLLLYRSWEPNSVLAAGSFIYRESCHPSIFSFVFRIGHPPHKVTLTLKVCLPSSIEAF